MRLESADEASYYKHRDESSTQLNRAYLGNKPEHAYHISIDGHNGVDPDKTLPVNGIVVQKDVLYEENRVARGI